jgi:hypothetical protein
MSDEPLRPFQDLLTRISEIPDGGLDAWIYFLASGLPSPSWKGKWKPLNPSWPGFRLNSMRHLVKLDHLELRDPETGELVMEYRPRKNTGEKPEPTEG